LWDRAYIYNGKCASGINLYRSDHSEWHIVLVGDDSYHIESTANGGGFRLLSFKADSWHRAYIYHSSYDQTSYESDEAKWRIEPVPREANTYHIVNKGSGARLLTDNTGSTWNRGYTYQVGYNDSLYHSQYSKWVISPAHPLLPIHNPYTRPELTTQADNNNQTEPQSIASAKGLLVPVALFFAAILLALQVTQYKTEDTDLISILKLVLACVSFPILALGAYNAGCTTKQSIERHLFFSAYNMNRAIDSFHETSEGSHDFVDQSKTALGTATHALGVGKAAELGCKLLPGL